MSLPRYPEYKDSGVEWLGEVPVHWKLMRFKWQIERNDGGVWGDDPDGEDDTVVLRSTEQTVDGNWKLDDPAMRKLSDAEKASSLLVNGDLLVTKSSGSALHIGKTTLVTQEIAALNCCYSNFMQRIRTADGIAPKLAWYLMNSEIARVQFDLASNSSTGLANLNGTMIGALVMGVPSSGEQADIVAFLDHETAKIESLVAEQEKLIALLKEKRQAVISHAVTKGLNPDVPMKDSGIEWLGEAPAHWDIGRVKTYFSTCSGGTPNTSQQDLYYTTEEDGIPWVRTTDLQNDVLRGVEVFITERALADTACTVLPPGTVMVAMYGGDGTVGKNGLLGISAAINQAVCGLLPSPTHIPGFVFRFMQFYRPFWMIGAESSRKDPNISQERVRNAPFLKPPIEEQVEIVTFLESNIQRFDELAGEAQHAIDFLQERRSAVISAAVTGKIDVRGFAAAKEAA